MSGLIRVLGGCPPWAPAPDAEIVEVVHRYNIPLLTVVEQAGTQFMARCLFGELGSTSLWIYNRLDGHEAVMLCQGSPEQVDEQADELSCGLVTVAIAIDDEIAFSTRLTVPEDLDLAGRARWITARLAEETETANRGSHELEREFIPAR